MQQLNTCTLATGTKVQQVVGQEGNQPARVVLADGQSVVARRGVVVAVEGPEAQRLLGSALEVRWLLMPSNQAWPPCMLGPWNRANLVQTLLPASSASCSGAANHSWLHAVHPVRQLILTPVQPVQASPSKPEAGVGTCCLYFKAAKAPSPEPILYLNGTPNGIVNNCCFPSTVAPSYAPAGQVGWLKRQGKMKCLRLLL